MSSEAVAIKPWMYRYPGEHFALFLGIFFFVVFGIFLGTINIYLLLGFALFGLFNAFALQSAQLGNSVRVYSKQFPELYEIFVAHARRLEIERASLYIRQDPSLNAFCVGVHTCTVSITSAMVEQFSKEELSVVIGHELAHFQAGHTKLTSLLAPMGQENLVNQFIFSLWSRRCEYSSDRCALALTKDLDTSLVTFMKLAVGSKLYKKLNLDAYVEQVKQAKGRDVAAGEFMASHPALTNRIKNALKYWNENFQMKGSDAGNG